MTKDVVALVAREPGVEDFGVGLGAAGVEWRVLGLEEGGVIQLCDEGGSLVMAVEMPVLIQVEGEVERVLGGEVAGLGVPLWWVEVRAAEDFAGAVGVALRFASALVERCGGVVWVDHPGHVDASGG